ESPSSSRTPSTSPPPPKTPPSPPNTCTSRSTPTPGPHSEELSSTDPLDHAPSSATPSLTSSPRTPLPRRTTSSS
ncbi:hypothetical protein NDU88_002907, partial [Pleurodeles waltl]